MSPNFKAAKVNCISLRSWTIRCLYKIWLNDLLENINVTVGNSRSVCLLYWYTWHMPMYMYKNDHLWNFSVKLKSVLLCFRAYAFPQNLAYYAQGFEGTSQLYVSSYEFFGKLKCLLYQIMLNTFYCLLSTNLFQHHWVHTNFWQWRERNLLLLLYYELNTQ